MAASEAEELIEQAEFLRRVLRIVTMRTPEESIDDAAASRMRRRPVVIMPPLPIRPTAIRRSAKEDAWRSGTTTLVDVGEELDLGHARQARVQRVVRHGGAAALEPIAYPQGIRQHDLVQPRAVLRLEMFANSLLL
jgi:hypothetical protein